MAKFQVAKFQNPFLDDVAALALRAVQALLLEKGADGSSKAGEVAPKDIEKLLSIPPSFDLGQSALPCFPFAKTLRAAPPQIAASLASTLHSYIKERRTSVARVEAVGGYLNFFCDFEQLGMDVFARIKDGSFFRFEDLAGRERIIVEYSQPNTHKALHVGHLRCLVLGDAVCNVLEYASHSVVRATYPGDMGAHVAKVLWYILHKTDVRLPSEERAKWLGEVYGEADVAFKAAQEGTEKDAVRQQISEILASLKTEKGRAYDLWKETREWSISEMKDVYEWLGTKFDAWYFESECDKPSVELVKRKHKEGFFQVSDGAIGLDLSEFNLGFAMYLKSDGNGLYLTKDLELLVRKFSEFHVQRSMYVVDARQKLHFRQLFKTAELMPLPGAERSVHLPYETVNTEDGKPFSSRAMRGLALHELRRLIEDKVTAEYLERYRGTWSDDDIRRTAEWVTIGALKYGMLKVDNNTQVNFVLSDWLRLDGETGPYLQYVHARCRNILEKQGRAETPFRFEGPEPAERELLFFLSRFNERALEAAETLRPSVIAGTLFDLGKLFNKFYESCPVRSSEGDLRNSRLSLVEATAAVMSKGLALLGIPAPDRM